MEWILRRNLFFLYLWYAINRKNNFYININELYLLNSSKLYSHSGIWFCYFFKERKVPNHSTANPQHRLLSQLQFKWLHNINNIKFELHHFSFFSFIFSPKQIKNITICSATILVNCHVLLGAVLREQAVGILMDTQFIQRRIVLAAEVATIAQLFLVVLDML